MSRQTWVEHISPDFVSSGTSFATFTTAKTVLPVGALIDFPKNFFTLGKKMRIEVSMGLSNIVTTPGTFTPSVRLAGNDVASSGAIQMTTTANTLAHVVMTVLLEVQVAGASAQFMHSWTMMGINVANTGGSGANLAAGTGFFSGPNPPALGTAFDATAALTLDWFHAFSISNGANAVQIRQYRVYSEN